MVAVASQGYPSTTLDELQKYYSVFTVRKQVIIIPLLPLLKLNHVRPYEGHFQTDDTYDDGPEYPRNQIYTSLYVYRNSHH